LAETHTRFITLEEHSLAGGFGSAVVEFINDRGLIVPVERIGVPNVLVHHAKPEVQRAQFGLTGEHVAARVMPCATRFAQPPGRSRRVDFAATSKESDPSC